MRGERPDDEGGIIRATYTLTFLAPLRRRLGEEEEATCHHRSRMEALESRPTHLLSSSLLTLRAYLVHVRIRMPSLKAGM